MKLSTSMTGAIFGGAAITGSTGATTATGFAASTALFLGWRGMVRLRLIAVGWSGCGPRVDANASRWRIVAVVQQKSGGDGGQS